MKSIPIHIFQLFKPVCIGLVTSLLSVCNLLADSKVASFNQSKAVTDILYMTCYDCHDDTEQKGGVRLDNLGELDHEVRLNVMNKMLEQVHFKNMPPKKKDHPSEKDRDILLGWLSEELGKHNASKLEEKIQMPQYANYVEHEQLFSGDHAHLKGYTPDRRWLISEYIFKEKINEVLTFRSQPKIHGVRQTLLGNQIPSNINVVNPFLLPTHSGVRYYANAALGSEHLLTMASNARILSVHLTEEIAKKNRSYLPAFTKLMEREYAHNDLLNSREQFLKTLMEPLLVDVYGAESHKSLMPEFKSTIPTLEADKTDSIKLVDPGYAFSRDEGIIVSTTIMKFRDDAKNDAELLLKCEEDWFYQGHNPMNVKRWLSYLVGGMDLWHAHMKRYSIAKNYRSPIYKPLDEAEMKAITATIKACRKKGDNYREIQEKCMELWRKELVDEREKHREEAQQWLPELIDQAFHRFFDRSPTKEEASQYLVLMQTFMRDFSNLESTQKLLQTLLMRSEFAYRMEFGTGEPDAHGRRMLSPRDASYAISYALTDSPPDEKLKHAAATGKLATKEDYEREVRRLLEKRDQYYIIDNALKANFTNLPIRKLRFFREFFGYPNMLSIFKDNKRFGGSHERTLQRPVIEADMLVEHILKEDKNVIETLLNTEKFYVFHSGDNEAMQKGAERISRIYRHFKDLPWADFTYEDLMKHHTFMKSVGLMGSPDETNQGRKKRTLNLFKTGMTNLTNRFKAGQSQVAPYTDWGFFEVTEGISVDTSGQPMSQPQVAHYFNLRLDEWDYPAQQPFKVPNRKGILTHPAWLMAHSLNTETDPVRRGKWVREKLLAGTIPEIPITVDAVIPEDHHKTLRTRLDEATGSKYCWRCHVQMNPLGTPFEMYDDFGRFRQQEALEHPENLIKLGKVKGRFHEDLRDEYKTLPVNASGELVGTENPALDGKVENALDLIERLAQSGRVRQSVIRHAFRYFMGRNEMLSDSKTLMDADKAYVESGGSFDAVIISLLTSDSFLYRKTINPEQD